MFKNKGFSAVALVILLAVLIGGGYVMWQKQTITPPSALPEGEGTPTSPLGGGLEGVKNWKTYRNDEYGFEFKYPLQWTVVPSVGADLILSLAPTQADESGATSIWLMGVQSDCKKMGWGDMGIEYYKEVCLGELSMGMQAISQTTQNLEDAILSTFRFTK
ncbi:MAG: hypothetical protein V1704_01395 [Candidatus Vogelbacteria bacterium]